MAKSARLTADFFRFANMFFYMIITRLLPKAKLSTLKTSFLQASVAGIS